MLMRLAKENDGKVSLAVAKKLRKQLEDAQTMHAMLTEYAVLGKPVVVIENGIKVTMCPPAYARGVWPSQKISSTAGGARGQS